MIALIDADILVYACAYAAQSSVDWEGDGVMHTVADLNAAQHEVTSMVDSIADAVAADRVILCLTPGGIGGGFRAKWWPDYKRQRTDPAKPPPRPVLYQEVRDYMRETYQVEERPQLEADDVMGIIATGKFKRYDDEKVVCSLDKDMLTIPGRHYNWRKDEVGVISIDEKDANWHFFMQAITGDRTDGYPGCPGIGPKRAEKALQEAYDRGGDELSMWQAVVATYASKGLTEDDALVQARCARILRASDYDLKTKEVIPWQPPTPN